MQKKPIMAAEPNLSRVPTTEDPVNFFRSASETSKHLSNSAEYGPFPAHRSSFAEIRETFGLPATLNEMGRGGIQKIFDTMERGLIRVNTPYAGDDR
jgi:hypothetical protein